VLGVAHGTPIRASWSGRSLLASTGRPVYLWEDGIIGVAVVKSANQVYGLRDVLEKVGYVRFLGRSRRIVL
jgi:hypothetical protein